MRFIENADEIPIELLNAQEECKLVIFAGAGVSIPAPSNLPNFEGLASRLVEKNGLSITKIEKESVDKFLGRVSDVISNNQYQLHKQVQDELSEIKSTNYLHKEILRLFKNQKVRIVTTNFDNLLSIAAEEDEITVQEYYAPALPLGDKFGGIVYLHGCIRDNYENLVLTDKDFSQAYICRGWATEFLKMLFKSEYKILFIGYSYDDVILNYLTRGIITNNAYAIIPKDKEQNWIHLGIKTIKYDNNDEKHTNLKLLLEKWREHFCCDLLSEVSKIEMLARKNPKLLDPFDIEYINKSIFLKLYRVERFLKNIDEYKNEWLFWLFENNYLTSVFSSKIGARLSEIDLRIANWFVNNFLSDENLYKRDYYGQNEGLVTTICKKYNYKIADDLAVTIERYFAQDISSQKIYAFWLEPLLNSNIAKQTREGFLTLHLKNCVEKNYTIQATLLLQHLLQVEYDYRKSELQYQAHSYWLRDLFKKFPEKFFEYFHILISTITNSLIKTSFLKRNYENSEKDLPGISYHIRAIERNMDIDDYEDDTKDLIFILRTSIDKMLKHDFETAKSYILQWLSSDLYVLNRMGIYGLYSDRILSADSVLDFFIEKDWLLDGLIYVHEVRHYFRLNYNKLSDPYKDKLLEKICEKPKDDTPQEWISALRFIRYIKDNPLNNECNILTACFEKIATKFDSNTNEIPRDLDSNWSAEGKGGIINFDWNVSVDSLLKYDLTNEDNINFLLNAKGEEYIEDEKWGDSREGVISKLAETVKIDFNWGVSLIKELLKRNIFDTDLYQAVFRGVNNSSIHNDGKSIERVKDFFEIINENINKINFDRGTGNYFINAIENVLKNENESIYSEEFIALVKDILFSIWKKADEDYELEEDVFTQAVNTIPGNIAVVFLKLLWIEYVQADRNISVFEKYKDFFENEIINKNDIKAKMGLSILSSRLFFLYSFDSKWVKDNIITKLDCNNEINESVWGAFLYTSPRFYKEIIDDLLPYFDMAINVNKQSFGLRDKGKSRFAEFYLLMFLATLIKNEDTSKFNLNKLLNQFNEQEVSSWYNNLSNRLKDAYVVQNMDIILNWIFVYWKNRLNITECEIEKSKSLFLIFSLEEYFPQCLDIIKTTTYNCFDEWIFYKLKESSLPDKYPDKVVELVNHIINTNNISSIQWHGDYLKELLQKLSQNINNLQELKCILEKLVQVGSSNDWAFALLQQINSEN